MGIIKNLKPWQAFGLAILFATFAAVLTGACHAETLTMFPAHTPYRAEPGMDPAWFGLLCTIAAILFLW